MIKILKIQKGIVLIVIGVIAIIAYTLMVMQKAENSQYVLGFAGVLFILGSLMLLYPILTAKKDKDGIVQLDPEKAAKEARRAEEKENRSQKLHKHMLQQPQ